MRKVQIFAPPFDMYPLPLDLRAQIVKIANKIGFPPCLVTNYNILSNFLTKIAKLSKSQRAAQLDHRNINCRKHFPVPKSGVDENSQTVTNRKWWGCVDFSVSFLLLFSQYTKNLAEIKENFELFNAKMCGKAAVIRRGNNRGNSVWKNTFVYVKWKVIFAFSIVIIWSHQAKSFQ